METLYRLSYWGLLPCGNEIKHTPNEGVLKTNLTCHLLLATSRLPGRASHRRAWSRPEAPIEGRPRPGPDSHAIDPD